MFHTRHTISIGQLAVLMDSRNVKLVRRVKIPIPEYFLRKAFNKLMKEVNETLNKTALEKEIESGMFKVKLYNKAFTLYPSLVNITFMAWDQKHLDTIELLTGYKLEKLEDREVLIEEMKRLQSKYREITIEEKKEGVSFYTVIIATEEVLGRSIDRGIKLFEFQGYMKQASEKIKQLEKRA